MVQFIGFSLAEEKEIKHLVARFATIGFNLDNLTTVERSQDMSYNGRVLPTQDSGALSMTVQLTSLSPFTVAHELAHVSDISTRRQESLDHLSLAMPSHWHLSYRMFSEYYANRVACEHAEENHVFEAFLCDVTGLRVAVRQEDWASVLINYALLLGIMDGMGRPDCEPLKLLPAETILPETVLAGIKKFRAEAEEFFQGYQREAA